MLPSPHPLSALLARRRPPAAPPRRGRLACLALAVLTPAGLLAALLPARHAGLVAPTGAGTAILLLAWAIGGVAGALLVLGPTRRRDDRRQARERELVQELERRRGEERFRSLVQGSLDMILVLGSDGQIVFQSPSVERGLGYGHGALIGRRLAELVEPGDDVPAGPRRRGGARGRRRLRVARAAARRHRAGARGRGLRPARRPVRRRARAHLARRARAQGLRAPARPSGLPRRRSPACPTAPSCSSACGPRRPARPCCTSTSTSSRR